MSIKTLLASTVALMVLAGSAQAITVVNRDGQVHQLSITEGEESSVVTIEADQTIEEICDGGCVLTLDEDDTKHEFEGDETLAIEDGNLVKVE